MRFEGRVALVTGASRGLGREVAVALAGEGAKVAVLGRDAHALGETAALIEGANSAALACIADVRSEDDVRRSIDEVAAVFKGLDLVVNAAGVLRTGQLTDFAEDDWNLLFDTNVKGCFFVMKHAIPALRIRGGGAIVNVSSVFAFAADRGTAAYSASKGALVALTQMASLDHIGEGIRVNGVAPGTMPTPMVQQIAAAVAPDAPKTILDSIDKLHPLGRMVEPREVTELILFLLSGAATAIVGQTYVVDGGRLAKLGSD